MIESFLIYSILAIIMMVCGFVESNSYMQSLKLGGLKQAEVRSFFTMPIIISIAVFTFVFGCRWNVGIDYKHYFYAYHHISFFEGKEQFFSWVAQSMFNAGIHYSVFFSLWAFIQITLLYYAFRRYRCLFPLIGFYLIFGFYFMSMMNVIRQQLAACVFLVAIEYLDNKKLLKYLACVFLAVLFHRSAMLLVVFYPLFFLKQDLFPKVNYQLVIFTAAFVMSIFFNQLIIDTIEKPFLLFTEWFGYDKYQLGILSNETLNSSSLFGNNTGFGVYVDLLKNIPVMLYSRKLKDYYNSSFFNICYSCWFIRIISEYLTGDSIILNRPFVYVYDFKLFILAAFTYYCFHQRKHFEMKLIGVMLILLHIVLLLNLLSNGEVNTSKFMFFWQAN